jgi:hypothetical protein
VYCNLPGRDSAECNQRPCAHHNAAWHRGLGSRCVHMWCETRDTVVCNMSCTLDEQAGRVACFVVTIQMYTGLPKSFAHSPSATLGPQRSRPRFPHPAPAASGAQQAWAAPRLLASSCMLNSHHQRPYMLLPPGHDLRHHEPMRPFWQHDSWQTCLHGTHSVGTTVGVDPAN